jgi:hypothetical protein
VFCGFFVSLLQTGRMVLEKSGPRSTDAPSREEFVKELDGRSSPRCPAELASPPQSYQWATTADPRTCWAETVSDPTQVIGGKECITCFGIYGCTLV